MNKLLLFFIAILIFAGCSKNNNNNPKPSSASISGKWISSADTLREYDSQGALKGTTPFTVSNSDYFQFNADGTGTTNDSNDTPIVIKFTYTVSGNTITFNFPEQNFNDAYAQKATIKQLTSNKLIIFFDDPSLVNGDIGTVTEIVYMFK